MIETAKECQLFGTVLLNPVMSKVTAPPRMRFAAHWLRVRFSPSFLAGVLTFMALLSLAPRTLGQAYDPTMAVGLIPYGSVHGGDIDSINLFNGNLNIHAPLLSYPQLGGKLRLTFEIVSNGKQVSLVHTCTNTCSYYWAFADSTIESKQSLVNVVDDQTVVFGTGSVFTVKSGNDSLSDEVVNVMTPDGAQHPTALTSRGFVTLDGTGIFFGGDNYQYPNGDSCSQQCGKFIDSNGVSYPFPGPLPMTARQDTNGNHITLTSSAYTDTIGRTIPTIPNPSTSADLTGCTGPLPTYSASVWNVPDPQGGTVTYKLCYAQMTLQAPAETVCGRLWGGAGPYVVPFLQSIYLPNGTSWVFQYADRDQGDASNINFGSLTQITLPTGASISYTYTTSCGGSGGSRAVSSRTVNANDGSGPHTWSYLWQISSSLPGISNIVQDPLGNQTLHNFDLSGGGILIPFETGTYYYSGSTSGTLLKSVSTGYIVVANPNPSYGPAVAFPNSVTTTWPNNQVQSVQTSYDSVPAYAGAAYSCCTYSYSGSYGNVITASVYDYGNAASGPLLKTTNTAYQAFSGPNASAYLANNLLSLPYTVQTLNGSGTQVALTTDGYDENNGSPQGAFGNQTSVTRWLNTGTSPKTQVVYNSQGMPKTTIDANLNSTQVTYDSTGLFPIQVQYPTTNNITHIEKSSFDSNTGLLISHTDQNNQTTSYQYDSMRRLTSVNYPDGGRTTYCYTDEGGPTCSQSGPPYQMVTTRAASPYPNIVSTTVYDGLGRISETQLNSDPDGTTYVDTVYDQAGRVYSVSNPYRSTSDSTYGHTYYAYDALGRTCLLSPADATTVPAMGSACPTAQPADSIFSVYSGNCTTVADEARSCCITQDKPLK